MHISAWAGPSWTVLACGITAPVVVVATWTAQRGLLETTIACAWALVLASVASIDARRQTIPNGLIYPALGVALVVVASTRGVDALFSALAGAAIAAAPFLIAFLIAGRLTLGVRYARSPQDGTRDGSVMWAGIAGALTVLGVGLLEADRPVAAIVASALVSITFTSSAFSGTVRSSSPARVRGARGMGGGDVKLAALLGVLAGGTAVLTPLLIAVIGGAVAALTLTFSSRGRSRILPYGPFLAAGGILALL